MLSCEVNKINNCLGGDPRQTSTTHGSTRDKDVLDYIIKLDTFFFLSFFLLFVCFFCLFVSFVCLFLFCFFLPLKMHKVTV